jgi:SAM-dependent methyltransferase
MDEVFRVGTCRCGMAYTVEIPGSEWFARYHSPVHNPELAAIGSAAVDTYEHSAAISQPTYARGLELLHDWGAAPRAKLLDVGCSEGYFVELARKAGYDARGVDPVPTACEGARARGLEVFEGSVADVPIPPGSLDVATSWDTIEHMADPAEVLSSVFRLLRPGGLFAVATPNFATEIVRISRDHSLRMPEVYHYWRGSMHSWDHINWYTPHTLQAQIEKAGLRVVDRALRLSMQGLPMRAKAATVARLGLYAATLGRVDCVGPMLFIARKPE